MCGTATSTCDDKTSLGGDKKTLPAIAAVASTVDGETVSPPPSNPYPSTNGFIIVFLRVRRAPPNNRSSPLITRRFSQRKYTLEHRTRFIGTDFFLRWSAQLPLFPSEISLRTRSGPSPRPRSRTTCTLILLSNYKYIYIVYHECACSCTSHVSGRCGKKKPKQKTLNCPFIRSSKHCDNNMKSRKSRFRCNVLQPGRYTRSTRYTHSVGHVPGQTYPTDDPGSSRTKLRGVLNPRPLSGM